MNHHFFQSGCSKGDCTVPAIDLQLEGQTMKHARLTILAAALAISASAAYADQHKTEDSSFVMHEYWQCDSDNIPALNKMSEEVWGPIFDELVAEGYFHGWGNLTPTGANRRGRHDEMPEQIALDHQWFGWWESASAAANDAAWAELGKRLLARYPDNPRPYLYCDTLTVVTYGN